MAESGFLVVADITGYTSYLSSSELEHASGILGDLLGLLLGETRAPLHLSRVEGDAVISYAQTIQGADPQVLVDRLEATYVAFRRALEQMILNNSCRCNACANINTLDLKFVVHHGPFVVQHLATQDELMGPEVNFMFRLVKNHVRQTLGIPGYIAFTDAAVAAIGLPGYAERLVDHTEEDPERGTVMLHVRDMGPVWEARRSQGFVELGEVMVELTRVLPVPVERAWGYVTRPETRSLLFGADKNEVDRLDDGRIGPEAVYVCFHGGVQVPHRIVDWDPPFRYVFSSPMPGGLSLLCEFRLEPVDETSTRLFYRAGRPTGSAIKAFLMRPGAKRVVAKMAAQGLEAFTAEVEKELAGTG